MFLGAARFVTTTLVSECCLFADIGPVLWYGPGMLKGFVVVMQPLADPNPRNEDGEDGDLGVPVLCTLTASEDDLTGLADNLR